MTHAVSTLALLAALLPAVAQAVDSSAPQRNEPAAGSAWTEPKTGMEFVWVPSGCFDMGFRDGEPDEALVHRVCVKGFYLGKYEVTQAQYQQVMGNNPSHFEGTTRPVEMVSWQDAKGYIEELHAKGGARLRLPSEAEWEYACRAGGEHEPYCGPGEVERMAWCKDNSDAETHPVGQLRPNAFGLYDMSGNVWEWVEDRYHPSYEGAPADGSAWTKGEQAERVLRGGSWDGGPWYSPRYERVSISNRLRSEPATRNYLNGFRLARTLP